MIKDKESHIVIKYKKINATRDVFRILMSKAGRIRIGYNVFSLGVLIKGKLSETVSKTDVIKYLISRGSKNKSN